MTVVFLLGWLLLIVAFVSAAATVAVRIYGGPSGPWVTLHDVFYTLFPGKLVVAQTWVERTLGQATWDYGLSPLMAVPGWLSFGALGTLLVWWAWPHRDNPADSGPDDTVFAFDDLARRAREEEDYDWRVDDRAPTTPRPRIDDADAQPPPFLDDETSRAAPSAGAHPPAPRRTPPGRKP